MPASFFLYPSITMPLSPGTKLGSYEILAPIGAGGQGEVYKARDPKLKREVAIKVLPEHLSSDPKYLSRLEREARALAALSHPSILSVFELGQEDGAIYVVMELLEGETLREQLRKGALPPRKAIGIVLQVLGGLAAAHEKGIVHRDLKPENLFVTRDGRVKILDFGLAKSSAGEDSESSTKTRETMPGTVLGTAGYMSPEQVRGEEADARSDLFSLGVVFYELLLGERAFSGDTA